MLMRGRALAPGRRAFSTAGERAPLADRAMSLLERVCSRVTANPTVCDQHGADESHHPAVPPQAVAWARSTEEVAAVVRVCAEERVPLVPFGAGTSLEGHVQALHGGISLDLSEMDAVLETHPEDMDCRVQCGVHRVALNESLRATGLHFPIDPGADASIGGMCATAASGTAAVKYGTMRENVLGLTVVTASGEVITTGGRARKSSAGYDLTRMFVGSEGTLGVITEVALKLHPLPSAVSAATCVLPSLHDAAGAVAAMLQCAVPLSRCEILDASTIEAFNAYATDVDDLEVGATLFLEFEGPTDASVAEAAGAAREVCEDAGAGEFKWASSESERRKLWAARHATYYAAKALRPGSLGIVTDAAVPISRLAEVRWIGEKRTPT